MAALVAPEETSMLPPNGKDPYNFGRDPIDNFRMAGPYAALAGALAAGAWYAKRRWGR